MPKRDNVVAAPLRPGEAASFNQQMRTLLQQYRGTLRGLRQQRSAVLGEFGTTRAAIRAQRQQELSAAENTAIERGVLGGSGELSDRAAVEANAATAIAQARHAKFATLAQLAQAGLQAKTEYSLGAFNLMQTKRAAQAVREAEELYSNVFGASGQGAGQADEVALSSAQQTTLHSALKRIKGLIDLYVESTGVERQELMDRLYALWRQRNELREAAGLKPIHEDRLWALIQAAKNG